MTTDVINTENETSVMALSKLVRKLSCSLFLVLEPKTNGLCVERIYTAQLSSVM